MIVVDPGHGGRDGGCSANGLMEKHLSLRTALVLRDLAKAVGLPLALTRETDQSMGLLTRGQLSEKLNASQVVSVHFDSNPDPHLGWLTCYCDVDDDRSMALGRAVIETAPDALKHGSRIIDVEPNGWKRRAYNVVHAYRSPALLIECCFVTNVANANFLRSSFGVAALASGFLAALLKTQTNLGGAKNDGLHAQKR